MGKLIILGATLLVLTSCAGTTIVEKRDPPSVYSIKLNRVGGGVVDFAKYKNKVLVIDFFATWMLESTVSIPRYSVLYSKYKDAGLEIVGISMDKLGEDVVLPFVQGMKIPYDVAMADEDIREGKSIFGKLDVFPLLLIFNSKGHLVKIFVGRCDIAEVEKVIRSQI
jgi:hypothetical protein